MAAFLNVAKCNFSSLGIFITINMLFYLKINHWCAMVNQISDTEIDSPIPTVIEIIICA